MASPLFHSDLLPAREPDQFAPASRVKIHAWVDNFILGWKRLKMLGIGRKSMVWTDLPPIGLVSEVWRAKTDILKWFKANPPMLNGEKAMRVVA